MWRLNFDVDVISPTPLQHHIHHILFIDDWFYAAFCSHTLDSTVHPLRISTYAPLRISTYAPFMKHRKFYHDNMIIWPRSPLIHRQSPQSLSQKPFFYVKIIAHLPPYSFPSPFQKDREKTSECGGRPAVTLRGLAVNLRRSRGQPYLWFMSMLSLWVRWRRHRNSNVT